MRLMARNGLGKADAPHSPHLHFGVQSPLTCASRVLGTSDLQAIVMGPKGNYRING